MRVGIGYDVHRLVVGRKLVLGGVTIPHAKGLKGHSDADVLIHAICDALLGAAGMGDIGEYFPDHDPQYEDESSLFFLEQVRMMLDRKALVIQHIDGVILAEEPKLLPYKGAMAAAMAEPLNLDPSRINIKATTTEGLGFIGNKEGIGAMCTVLVS